MTSPGTETPNDQTAVRVGRVELFISGLLRTGVAASLAVIVFGTVISFVHHPTYLHSATELQRLASPGAAFPHTLYEIGQGLLAWRGQAFVATGLMLLIATPILRVAVSVFVFLYQRDRIFVAITAIVLTLLLLSFALGKVE